MTNPFATSINLLREELRAVSFEKSSLSLGKWEPPEVVDIGTVISKNYKFNIWLKRIRIFPVREHIMINLKKYPLTNIE